MAGSKTKAAGSSKVVKEVKGKKEAKPKKVKDENAPKRPLSSYLFFCNAKREETKKKYPSDNTVKKLGELWNKLDDKSEYEEMARQAKADYEVRMEEYKSNGGGSTSSSTAAKGNKRKQPEKKTAVMTKKNVKKAKMEETKPETSEEDEEEDEESSADEKQKKSNLSDESGSVADSDEADE